MNIINKEFEVFGHFETSTVKSEDGVVRISGYANTVDKDRAGDVILESAWKSANAMGNYEKNPIILAFHDHDLPIGKMVNYRIDSKGLWIEAEIDDSEEKIYKKVKRGILKTFSVGFRCLDAEYKEANDTYFIKDLELMEVSVVSVPCNQDSTFNVSKAVKPSVAVSSDSFKTEKKDVRDAVLDESPLLSALTTLDVKAKFGLQPYTEANGLQVVKEVTVGYTLDKAEAVLVKETQEDATIDLKARMDSIMRDDMILKAEKNMVTLLKSKAGDAKSASGSKTWATVVAMYLSLAKEVRRAKGQVYFFTGVDTATNIMESTAYFQSELKDKIKIIGAEDLLAADAILAHSHGIFGRLDINRGIEVEKLLPSDAEKHYLGYKYGLEVDKSYVVKKSLS